MTAAAVAGIAHGIPATLQKDIRQSSDYAYRRQPLACRQIRGTAPVAAHAKPTFVRRTALTTGNGLSNRRGGGQAPRPRRIPRPGQDEQRARVPQWRMPDMLCIVEMRHVPEPPPPTSATRAKEIR
jgi:hypothetical protein